MHDQDSPPRRPPPRGRLLVNPSTRTLDPPPRGRLLVRPRDPPDHQTTTPVLLSKYDAFISFRGDDIRDNFQSHLYTYMNDTRKIATFKDNVDLKRGDQISPALARAIETSSSYVVVFSPNYATSKWCLDELVKILECVEKYGRKLIPIFYDGVDPSIVKNRTGSYGDAFKEHEKLPQEMQPKVQTWRRALREAAHFAGFDSRVVKPESQLIRDVAKSVLDAVIPHQNPSPSINNLVGIEQEMKDVTALLEVNDKEHNRIIGFWGMGGIGKTTLAKEIFQNIKPEEFEACHYIQNFAAQLKRTEVTDLQNELFSKLLEDESAHTMPIHLKLNRLGRKRCFVVIDDVLGSTIQLEALLAGKLCKLFGPGSRIILTSTDRQVLRQVCQEVHKVKGLDGDKALQLLSMYAFKKDSPPSEYVERCRKIVSYASGNPLALKVLGSALYQRKMEYWDGTLDKLRSLPSKEIEDLLMISFDGLSDEEQSAFLDVACFFNHEDLDFVTRVLDDVLVTNLVDKSLADEGNTDDNKRMVIEMHALLEDLGRKIVNKEKLIGKRSRLWDPEDVQPLLNQNLGTEHTEGIFLNLSETKEIRSAKSDMFERMRNLRLLCIQASVNGKLNSAHVLPEGIRSLPYELRYLQWDLFTETSLPSGLWAQNLLVLRLKHSNIRQLWEGANLELGNLKELNLFASKFLTELPDLSSSKKLELIDLTSCTSLTELHDSVIHLPNLKTLILNSCEALNFDNLNNKEDNEENPAFPSLEEANLDKTPIEIVPHPIISAPKLSKLRCSSCRQLSEFPNISERHETLLELNVSNCDGISSIPNSVTNLVNLEVFDLSGTGIVELPSSVLELEKLEELKFAQCKKLVTIPSSFKRLTHLDKLVFEGCDLLSNKKPELPGGLEYQCGDDGEHINTKSKVHK